MKWLLCRLFGHRWTLNSTLSTFVICERCDRMEWLR